jgi:hypothetical protein
LRIPRETTGYAGKLGEVPVKMNVLATGEETWIPIEVQTLKVLEDVIEVYPK